VEFVDGLCLGIAFDLCDLFGRQFVTRETPTDMIRRK
jgi:hypothetical protein